MNFETVLHQLYQTTRIISKGLNRTLEPLGIYASEWSIILLLKENGSMTQSGLASYLNIEPPAITRSLVRLEKKGFVKRKPGNDKREKKVYLTDNALEKYPLWAEVVTNHQQLLLGRLTDFEQEELYKLLQGIFQRAQELEKSNKG